MVKRVLCCGRELMRYGEGDVMYGVWCCLKHGAML